MTKEIQLSICIATHNRSSFLKEAITSFIPQLSDEIELIVVDGASTDDEPPASALNLKNS